MSKVLKELWQVFGGLLIIVPFFVASLIIVKHHNGVLSLILASVINSEHAVTAWVKRGHSYPMAYLVCSICGNSDLIIWFHILSRMPFIKRYILSKTRPVGEMVNQASQSVSQSMPTGFFVTWTWLKSIVLWLDDKFKKHPYKFLFTYGLIPYMMFPGVNAALAHRVKNGYFVLAAGNTLKIIIFGYLISKSYGGWLYDKL